MTLHIIIIAVFMAVAILLLLLETFLLPGITIAGVGGAMFAIGGIVYAYSVGATIGHVTLGGSVVVFGACFLWLLRGKAFKRIALNTNIEAKVQSTKELGLHVGDTGVTLSRLAPVGKARFGNVTVEAKANENFIDEQTNVIITHIDGYQVVVKTVL